MHARDYPVIDITLKFCEIYLHTGSQLYELRLDKEPDRSVIHWLMDLRAIAQAAKTEVLVAEFRGAGGGTPKPDTNPLLQ